MWASFKMVRIFLAVTVVLAALTIRGTEGQPPQCPADLYAHADCSKFYKCAHGQVSVHDCPANLQFNSETKTCDYEWRVKCTSKDSNSNPCLNNPCQNGGVCNAGSTGGYTCNCAFGYYGENCQYRDNGNTGGCFPVNPCQNAGQCIGTADGSYRCQCVGGYHGFKCEVSPERSCSDTKKCLNGGYCPPPQYQRQYRCWCNGGYQGTNCEIAPSGQLCQGVSPCQNGGNCYIVAGNTVCSCIKGYSGVNCQVGPETSPCYPNNPCQNGGTCSLTSTSTYSCRCTSGYTGPQCQGRSLYHD